MEAGEWIAGNWFVLLQSIGIISGLVFAALSFRMDAKTQRYANLHFITGHHAELWTQLHRRPELARILDESVDLEGEPVTPQEEWFIKLLILHLNNVHWAIRNRLYETPQGLRKDIRFFLSLPIPRAVWEEMKAFHDREFIRFVERAFTEGWRD